MRLMVHADRVTHIQPDQNLGSVLPKQGPIITTLEPSPVIF